MSASHAGFPPPTPSHEGAVPSAESDEDRSLLASGEHRDGGDGVGARTGGRLLRGFLSYSVASEVFSIVSLGLFLPVCLEQLARENGYLVPDHNLRCPPSSEDVGDGTDAQRCAVHLLLWIDTASFALFVYSASVALQAICVISLGTLADHPRTRHRLLSLFACAGSILTMSFPLFPSSSPVWFLAAFLALGANVSFGASMVCLNSYLPELGRRNPKVVAKSEALHDAKDAVKHLRNASNHTPSSDELLRASQTLALAQEEFVMERGLVTSTVSATGVAAGYAAGILMLVVLLIPVTLSKGSTFAIQCAIGTSGLWWFLGSFPALFWLRPPADALPPPEVAKLGYLASAAEGWRGLGRMLREWRRLPSTFVFLAAWFLLSDAFATLTSTAMLFGKTSLGMSTSSLILISIISPSSGIAGAILFPRLQKTVLQWSNLKILQLLVSLACLIPIWGLVALRAQWQMYFLAVVFGGLYGSFQSYARSCFSELVPSSQAARWFGLYSITDKSSSFLGPLLVAVVTNATQEIRHGFFLILGMLVISLPILASVDMDKGRSDAEEYERAIVESLIVEASEEEE